MGGEKPDPIGQIIGGIVVLGMLFYLFVWPPLVAWWEANWYWVVTGLLIALGLVGYWFFKWLTKDTPEYAYRDRVSSAANSDPTIVHRHLLEQETIEEPSLSLFNSVIREIEEFKPFRKYQLESQYQIELARYLKNKFPSTKFEEQRGYSRPDIVVDNIAIEVKGPTKRRDLNTIPSKLMQYNQHFNGGVIVVLFDVDIEEGSYNEWYRGLKNTWPNVKVIQVG